MKNMLGEEVINEFRGDYYFLSNFYPAPIVVKDMGMVDTVEHAFQAAKTIDLEEMKKIFKAYSPALAKQLGKTVTLRNDWQEIKNDLMYQLVRLKFLSHPDLHQKLQDTGEAMLIEGNTWGDTYWGVCNGVGKIC